MLEFLYAVRASQGARSYQEDAAQTWRPANAPTARPDTGTLLAVLADGMGGHAGGAVASSTVCRVFADVFGRSAGTDGARLGQALDAANTAVRQESERNATLAGMGATVVGVYFSARRARWVSVGDSPMFLFRRGGLTRLNEDHSLGPVLDRFVAEGKMKAADARHDPRRHYLRSAVTGEAIELVDRCKQPAQLEAGDVILLASDGVLTLDDPEIASVMAVTQAAGADAMAEALLAAVDAAGHPHQDNTTVIVVMAQAAASR